MRGVLTGTGEATPEWLTRVLRRSGALQAGAVTGVQEIRSDIPPDSHNSIVASLRLDYSADTNPAAPDRLFLKLSAKPEPAIASREVEFYNLVAPATVEALPSGERSELPFVRCYDAAYSPELSRFHLLLEDLSETHHTPNRAMPPDEPCCEQMVEALACFHAAWWEHPRLGHDIGQRPSPASLDEALAWAQRNLAGYVEFMGDRLATSRGHMLERICTAWPKRRRERIVDGRGITLVNRDTHAANFLYPRDTAAHRVRIIDWQSWRVDTGTDDLAYMMAAHWYPERRARLEMSLLRRYHDRLLAGGVQQYSWDDCCYDYRASIVRVLFFLVGGWHPARPLSPFWDRVERTWLAFEDLGCADIVPGE